MTSLSLPILFSTNAVLLRLAKCHPFIGVCGRLWGRISYVSQCLVAVNNHTGMLSDHALLWSSDLFSDGHWHGQIQSQQLMLFNNKVFMCITWRVEPSSTLVVVGITSHHITSLYITSHHITYITSRQVPLHHIPPEHIKSQHRHDMHGMTWHVVTWQYITYHIRQIHYISSYHGIFTSLDVNTSRHLITSKSHLL